MGSIASERGVEVKDVATKGAGLAFILYPDAITRFPYSQIWSIMFFFMLSLLGFGSQFACMETVVTAIFDLFPQKRKLKVYILGLLCFVMFSCGLIFCTNVSFN
jgi:SNF family Na+-dependent transporter